MNGFLIFELCITALTCLIAHFFLRKDRHIYQYYPAMVFLIGLLWPMTWIWVAFNIWDKYKADREEKRVKASKNESIPLQP